MTDDPPRTGLYKWGELVRSGTTFEMPFQEPRDEARATPALALALVVEIAADAVVADGDVDEEQLSPIQGLSTEHAVIHRSGVTGFAWADAFPLGYSCGRCVYSDRGDEEDDWYEPAPCSEFEVVTGITEDTRVCDWR